VEGWAAVEHESTAVTSDGHLGLALATAVVEGLEAFVIWDLLPDGEDLLVATGDAGVLYRVSSEGTVTEAARVIQPEITALGRDGAGRVLLGAAPDGILYRVGDEGAVVAADTPESYVWRILPHSRGGALVASGDAGKIYRLTPDDGLLVFADLGTAHVTGLEAHEDGYLVTTDSPGRLVLLDPDGNATVLHDAEEPELRSPVVQPDGAIYFIANPETDPGRVYRLNDSKAVDLIWSVTSGFLYSMSSDESGTLWIATGSEAGAGTLVELHPGSPVTWMEAVHVDEPQVLTTFFGDGHRWIGTGGLGRLYRILKDQAARGVATGPVQDAGGRASWGALTLEPGPPEGGVTLETRSGNTRVPDETWSSWDVVPLDGVRGSVPSPQARFLQWRVLLESGRPRVGGVRVVYLPANVAPRLTEASISELGQTMKRAMDRTQPSSMFQELPGGVRVEFQTSANRTGNGEAVDESVAWARRYRTVTWVAEDANRDAMRFEISLRAAGETVWKPLAEDLESSPWVWDSGTVPDGWYRIRVRASDHPDNPTGRELVVYRTTTSFLVHTTPPEVTGLKVTNRTLIGVAEDSSSPIKKLELAVDGKSWTQMFPRDGIPDMPREPFESLLPDLESGEHVVVVRVFDLAGNPGTGRVSFTTP
jgi:hypothetical protein